jgi:hypothetical protein
VGWLYRPSYFGPDRRSSRFQLRFIDRRREIDAGTRASLRTSLKRLAATGLRWVDHLNYFGPDRRRDGFSLFILERRRHSSVGAPPSLHAALRQLRVRSLETENDDARHALCERVTATAVLADAQGRSDIGDLLAELARKLDSTESGDLANVVQTELLRSGAMLADSPARS